MNIYTDLSDCRHRIKILENIKKEEGLSEVKAEQLKILYECEQELQDN